MLYQFVRLIVFACAGHPLILDLSIAPAYHCYILNCWDMWVLCVWSMERSRNMHEIKCASQLSLLFISLPFICHSCVPDSYYSSLLHFPHICIPSDPFSSPFHSYRDFGELWALPLWGLGQSPSPYRNWIWCIPAVNTANLWSLEMHRLFSNQWRIQKFRKGKAQDKANVYMYIMNCTRFIWKSYLLKKKSEQEGRLPHHPI